jgi:hypothetical protein
MKAILSVPNECYFDLPYSFYVILKFIILILLSKVITFYATRKKFIVKITKDEIG